jgi:predicted RNA polymerase sigma factor
VLKGAGLQDEARSEWLTSVSRLKAKLELADNERTRMFLAMMLAQIDQPAEAREQVQRAFALNLTFAAQSLLQGAGGGK